MSELNVFVLILLVFGLVLAVIALLLLIAIAFHDRWSERSRQKNEGAYDEEQ